MAWFGLNLCTAKYQTRAMFVVWLLVTPTPATGDDSEQDIVLLERASTGCGPVAPTFCHSQSGFEAGTACHARVDPAVPVHNGFDSQVAEPIMLPSGAPGFRLSPETASSYFWPAGAVDRGVRGPQPESIMGEPLNALLSALFATRRPAWADAWRLDFDGDGHEDAFVYDPEAGLRYLPSLNPDAAQVLQEAPSGAEYAQVGTVDLNLDARPELYLVVVVLEPSEIQEYILVTPSLEVLVTGVPIAECP